MTSSSSLYGTVTTQNTSSGNSTGLYGEAGTPIPDSSGNVVVRGDLLVLSGNILTTATTGNIFPQNATTVNLGLAATAVNIGAGTGTTTINNDLVINGTFTAPSADFGNIQIAVVDNQTISTTAGELRLSSTSDAIKLVGTTSVYTDNTGTFNLLNQPTTVNAFLAATTLNIGANGGETNINNDLLVEGTGTFTGDITAPGADFGAITIAITDDQTIATTSGELRLGSNSGAVKFTGVDTLYTDTTGTFNLLNQPTTVFAFRNATTLGLGEDTGTTTINNNLTVDGTTVSLAQNTTIAYSENNDRLNRPSVKSTTGNTSGLRVEAPNTGTTAAAIISASNSSDPLNSKFININARGSSVTNDLRIQTGKYTAGVLGASGSVVSFVDNITTYATVNPAGPTDALDLTTKTYVDGLSGTTYTINASTTTGGANFNLVGSDSTTDTIKFAQGTGISVSRTDANTITITNTAPDTTVTYTQNISSTTGGANLNLVGSDSTTDTVKFANGTGVTVAYTDASTATVSIGQAVATTDDVVFNSVQTPDIFNAGGVTVAGGTFTPSNIVVGDDIVASLTGGLGGDTATLIANAGTLTWNHVAGAMVIGSEDGVWSLNADGTTSFPNFIFPYADGTSNQVLRTNGSGVLSWYTPSDLNTTYTIDASATTGGANLNLVGSDSSTDTVKFAEGLGIDIVQTDANTVTTSLNATLDNLSNVDNTTTALASGQMFYYNGTNWVNSDAVDSPNISRFIRTNAGTANNAIMGLSRNRGDAARAVDGGPWLGFEYVGTDNTQATAPQNAIRSRYQTSGNHQLQFVQLAGSYNAVTVMGQIQRGSTFFNTTAGVSNLALTDTTAVLRGTTTTIGNSAGTQTYASLGATSGNINQDSFSIRNNAGTTTYAQFLSTGATISAAGLSTVTRTTVGTPGVAENRPSMNIQLIRSDQATPNDGDGTSFRTRVGGSNGTFYTLSDINSTYDTAGDVSYNINLANGDQTGATFNALPVYSGSITNTIIRAGTASATPGASTVSSVAKFEATKITAFVPVKFPAYTAAAANAITGEIGWQICISDSAQGSNPNGMMAFWDTTNSRWSYIHDNSAV
jgi:hypothetical protein